MLQYCVGHSWDQIVFVVVFLRLPLLVRLWLLERTGLMKHRRQEPFCKRRVAKEPGGSVRFNQEKGRCDAQCSSHGLSCKLDRQHNKLACSVLLAWLSTDCGSKVANELSKVEVSRADGFAKREADRSWLSAEAALSGQILHANWDAGARFASVSVGSVAMFIDIWSKVLPDDMEMIQTSQRWSSDLHSVCCALWQSQAPCETPNAFDMSCPRAPSEAQHFRSSAFQYFSRYDNNHLFTLHAKLACSSTGFLLHCLQPSTSSATRPSESHRKTIDGIRVGQMPKYRVLLRIPSLQFRALIRQPLAVRWHRRVHALLNFHASGSRNTAHRPL